MLTNHTEKYIYYTLRIATSMCFIGHGAFGMITKPIWCNYFAVFGIGTKLAYELMPVVGSIDILLGIIFLIYPVRIIPVWLVIWGTVTALLRPLSGEPLAEFFERAGNFGAPLAFLMMSGNFTLYTRNLFSKITPNIPLNDLNYNRLINTLRIIAFSLFMGHGWLNLIEKKGLIQQYHTLGISNPIIWAHVIGIMEIISAFVLLIRPTRPIVFIFLAWKIGSELLYPHYELFEWIERGGSYGILLALWFALPSSRKIIEVRKNAKSLFADQLTHFFHFK